AGTEIVRGAGTEIVRAVKSNISRPLPPHKPPRPPREQTASSTKRLFASRDPIYSRGRSERRAARLVRFQGPRIHLPSPDEVMPREPRRLRNLNFEELDEEPVEEELEDVEENEENLQGPPDIDNILAGLPQKPADPIKIICDNSSQHESSDNVDYDHNGSDRNHEETNANVHSPTHSEQRSCAPMYAATEEDYAQPSLPREHMNAKKKQTESHKQADQGYAIADLPRHSLVMNKGSRRVNPPGPNRSKTGNIEVYLFSLRTKDKVLAKGQLVTTDSRRVILGHMLGSDFFGVHVDGLENLSRGNTGEETLPRPYEQIRTIRDAVGYVIAWPRTHVKKLKSSSQTGKNLNA
ncbi:hypothetical protein EJB05_03105, partial [Eragrostis curvula]